jgi:probable F420-dependent oxidoreductase
MKFSVNLPLAQIHPRDEFQTPQAVSEVALALERSGVCAGRLTDHPAPSADWLHNDPTGHDSLDPFTGLAFVAAATTRLLLMTSVIILPYRNPFLTAKAAATLQVLSGGRLILGVGVGYQKAEFDALGVPFQQRGALTDDALETIRLAWAGGVVARSGIGYDAPGNEPRPVPSPAPPIWIGGGSRKAVARAARWGDGWAPFFSVTTNDRYVAEAAVTSLTDLREKIALLVELRNNMGRSGPFEISITPPNFPRSRAREEVEKFLETVAVLEQAGVNWLTIALPAHDRATYLESVDWFSKEVVVPYARLSSTASDT